MRTYKLLICIVLTVCCLLTGCAYDKSAVSEDTTVKTKEETGYEMLFSDVAELEMNGSLYWVQDDIEDGKYSSFYCMYDFEEQKLTKQELISDDLMYLIQSNYPEGIIGVKHKEEDQYEFWTISKNKLPQKRKTVYIENGNGVIAVYDGNIYYWDEYHNLGMKPLNGKKSLTYDPSVFEDIAVSPEGKVLFLNRIVEEYESRGRYYSHTVYELGLAEPGKDWKKIPLPENCAIESPLSVQGAWIDGKQAVLALPMKVGKEVELVAYQFFVETNQLVECRTQDGKDLTLCAGKNNLVDGSLALSPDGTHVAYLVYDIRNASALKPTLSFFKDAEERTYIIVASLETGEKYLISDLTFTEGMETIVYDPLLWRN